MMENVHAIALTFVATDRLEPQTANKCKHLISDCWNQQMEGI